MSRATMMHICHDELHNPPTMLYFLYIDDIVKLRALSIDV